MFKIFSIIFSLSGLAFILSILIHKLYVSKLKDMMKVSQFVVIISIFMGIYILSGIVLAFFMPYILNRILVLLFALSPFIIGKFATYTKEKMYSLIQIICVLTSIIFVLAKL